MYSRNEITAELTAINASCVNWPVEVPYQVPVGYFDALSELVLEHITIGLPVKTNVYSIPDHYFDELPENLLSIIRKTEIEQELEEIAPLLTTISKTTPYTLPSASVISIESIIQESTKTEGAKLVSMPVKKSGVWMRMAVAAVTIGILVIAAFIYSDDKVSSKDTVMNYAQMDITNAISQLSEDELTTYLSGAEKLIIATADREQLLIDELPDVNDHLEYMSDDELNEYLQESAESTSGDATGVNS